MTHSISAHVPKYRLHKPKGLGVVRLNGRNVYLGRRNTPESLTEYRRVINEWLVSGGAVAVGAASGTAASPVVDNLAVSELVLRYFQFAKTYYVKNGRPINEITNIKNALRALIATHASVAVTAFGPTGLKAVRQTMVDLGWCRSLINQRVNVIRRVFKLGGGERDRSRDCSAWAPSGGSSQAWPVRGPRNTPGSAGARSRRGSHTAGCTPSDRRDDPAAAAHRHAPR